MKTNFSLILSFVLLLSAPGLLAQTKTEKLYDAFRNKPGVSYFAFSKDMADVFNLDLDEEGKTIEGDISEVRLLTYNPEKGQLSNDDFLKKSAGLMPSSCKLVETDDADNAKIWMEGNRQKASEFHILIGGDNPQSMSFLISFYGDFDIKDLEGIKAVGHEMATDN